MRHRACQRLGLNPMAMTPASIRCPGLVEKRTKAIVPVVMDLLNLVNGTDNHYKSLGGFATHSLALHQRLLFSLRGSPVFVGGRYTFEFADYLEAGVVGTTLFTANYSKLVDIVDAFSYFKQGAPWTSAAFNRMPKLVVNAGNDEFFLPDDDHSVSAIASAGGPSTPSATAPDMPQWWAELPGEKHRLYVPNADHPFRFLPPLPPGCESARQQRCGLRTATDVVYCFKMSGLSSYLTIVL